MTEAAPFDPRDRITPTAFEIAPGLLGVALASPVRRALALGADLLLAGIIAAVGGPAAAGVAAAVLFVLVGMRRRSGGRFRRLVRGTLVSIGALILFGVTMGLLDDARDGPEDRVEAFARAADGPDRVPAVAWTDSARAVAAADLRAFADAVSRADSAAVDTLRDAAAIAAAGRALRQGEADAAFWRGEFDRARDHAEGLQEEIDAPTFRHTALAVAADFGLTLGWIGAYFTLTLAFWNGYTPGKRLLGIRAVRLDGRRVSLWAAFERFGGYLAGVFTGLLGFAQILWDPNRQGVQDKIAGTAVVRMADARTLRRAG